jgi:hypothetical protein
VLRPLQLAQLRGDLDPLRLAPGKRGRRLAERKVSQSQVSGLYLNASRTKQPPMMLRRGSGTSSSGCVSFWTPRPPHVRHALSGLLKMLD